MHRTQRIPVESLASQLHLFVDLVDMPSQHDEHRLAQAVHHRVVAADKFVQIGHVAETKVETMSGQRLHQSVFHW